MWKNYLILALRIMRRQVLYSFINIFGLAVGLACSLVILLYVYGEWSVDRGFANADRIYRIGTSFFNLGQFAVSQERLLDVLPREFAGVETATRVQTDQEVLFRQGTRSFLEPEVYYTDSAFFKVFDYEFIAGDPRRVLYQPNEMVVSSTVALKFFGRTDVTGEILEVGKKHEPYTITGVVKPLAFASQFTTGVWLSNHKQLTGEPAWTSIAVYNFVLTKPGVTLSQVEAALDRVMEKHVFPEAGTQMGFKSLQDYVANQNSVKFYVHGLKDIYLKSTLMAELKPGGNITNLYIFSAVALFILFLAAVNFINLSTARAVRRGREVGIRKVLGTSRRNLIGQHLLESVLTSLMAMVLAAALAELFIMLYHQMTGQVLLVANTSAWQIGVLCLLSALVVGLLAGIYPALYLTAFAPADVLKGSLRLGASRLRSALVVFQFTVSIMLIVCALIMQQQIGFIKSADLGFDQEGVVTIDNALLLGQQRQAFMDELSAQSGVRQASGHAGEPGSKKVITALYFSSPAKPDGVSLNAYPADENFVAVMGMQLLKGRTFNRDLKSDTAAVLLNEKAVQALGLPADPVGMTISDGKQTVIGVIRDFHWESLRNEIGPVAITRTTKEFFQLSFKVTAADVPHFLQVAESKWKAALPDEPFHYHFLDQNFADLLKKDESLGQAIYFFTVLAIVLSCLGLYGLAAYTAEQRTKEIGIRKVLGASAASMVQLLSRNFLSLVLIAFVLASPLAWWLMHRWLQGFANRVEPGVGIFLLTGLLAAVVAALTIGWQTWRAARTNPVDSLRSE